MHTPQHDLAQAEARAARRRPLRTLVTVVAAMALALSATAMAPQVTTTAAPHAADIAAGIAAGIDVAAARDRVAVRDSARPTDDAVRNPAVSGPTTNGIRPNAWNASTFALTTPEYDYREDEYSYSGTADYLQGDTSEAYTSRFIIRQPADAADFNGIILLDWMNVTNGQDWEYNWWPTAYDYLMREGYAIVAVSAQASGVRHLQTWDPVRYGDLDHPGDDYSFDIFAQAIEATSDGTNNVAVNGEVVDPMLGRLVDKVIGGGVSQSAGRLISYIDNGYTRGRVDAWHIERALGSTPKNHDVLTFILNEETGFTGGETKEQAADTDLLRVWEEAGIAHHSIEWWDYTYASMNRDLGAPEQVDPVDAACSVNRGTNGYSVRAMLHHTQVYFEDGTLPPSAPRIPRGVARDEDNLITGGLRHPFVEVPIASNTSRAPATGDCVNWGHYEPWSNAKITSRYETHADYVQQVADYSVSQVGKGLLLHEDCVDAVETAYRFTDPWPDAQSTPIASCGVGGDDDNGPYDNAVANPLVDGPTVNGSQPNMWNASTFPLSTNDYEYIEDEYTYAGTAEYFPAGVSTGVAIPAPYKSRFVIRQPKDAADFNGTVLVDWMNVTNGEDWEYNWWPTAYDYLMREGYAIVAVSAQMTGVRHLQTWDTERYGSLLHPGDSFSYDIFAQAIEAVRDGRNNQQVGLRVVDPMLGREVENVIGGGVSQSASRLITFIDQGYNRGRIDAWNLERALGSTPSNLDTFVFVLNEETNYSGSPMPVQQADSDGLRVWEEAGVAHHSIEWYDYTLAGYERDDPSSAPGFGSGCSVNRGTNGYSVRAMLHHTQAYLDTGQLPPAAPRIPRNADGSLPRDADTLVEGGLRHPFVEVPIATNRSMSQDCTNWGTYIEWDDAMIAERYPTQQDYVCRTTSWSDHQVAAGLLLAEDRDDAIARAMNVTSPWPSEDTMPCVEEEGRDG